MEKIRCLVADMPHELLADIIKKTAETRPEIEIVDKILNHKDLIDFIEKEPVDALVLEMEDGFEICTIDKIFNLLPQAVVIGVIDNGRRICMCLEDGGPKVLMDLICVKKTRTE